MNLSEKLAELRKAKGMTQKELAGALNVTRQAVSRWEVGTAVPSLDNLAYLSRLYGVPLDDFIQDGTGGPEEGLEDAPAEAPVKTARTGRPYALACGLLAVLILGVGILIGVTLRKGFKKEVYLYAVPHAPQIEENSQITVGWLEKTPADLEDEAQWLEEASGNLPEEKETLP